MSGFGPGAPFLADCPACLAVELIADKSTVVVLYGLSKGSGLGAVDGGRLVRQRP